MWEFFGEKSLNDKITHIILVIKTMQKYKKKNTKNTIISKKGSINILNMTVEKYVVFVLK